MNRRVGRAFLAVSVLLLAGCPETWRRPVKTPVSALWVGEGSPPLEAAELGRLRQAGIGELFVEVGRLDGAAVTPVALPAIAGGGSATLVVGGRWTAPPDPGAFGKSLGEPLRGLRYEAEGKGLVVVGVHFDLAGVDSVASYAEALAAVREDLDRGLFLSATLARGQVEDPELPRLAEAVDFLVPFLYGQRVEEAEAVDAWDFIVLEGRLRKLEELGEPYLVGVVTLGTATQRRRGGEMVDRTTVASLQEALTDRRFRLKPGFSLQGANRRVYEVIAEEAVELGDRRIAAGDLLRIVRPATADLEELMRRLDAAGLRHHLGVLFYRASRLEERLSVGLDGLAAALDPAPSTPDLELTAAIQRRTPGGWLLRFGLVNRNGEATELSLLDNNYLEVRLPKGELTSRVDPGGFHRFDLGRRDGGAFARELRRPDTLRLHLPLLEGRQTVSSGDVLVAAGGGSLELELFASFLLPDGRTAIVGPHRWKDGELLLPAAEPPAAGEGGA